jgi:hypothetical protein
MCLVALFMASDDDPLLLSSGRNQRFHRDGRF